MLRWEWFRIYFESGLVKILSGDRHWRDFTAMDDYYQNGPLPAWPGWYVQHFPHWYHATTVGITFAIELFVVWAMFLPRKARIACFVAVTALQVGIIATANYAFLNYLVLVLGFLLLDDRAVAWVIRHARLGGVAERMEARATGAVAPEPSATRRAVEGVMMGWIFYATIWAFLAGGSRNPLALPERALEPFRIANPYGLFATMTEARYEIEFQGTDGQRCDVDAVRFPLQAAGRERAARHLRAVPATLRVESVVRVARAVAVVALGARSAASACSNEAPVCSHCFAAIRSTGNRRKPFGRCSGSTGSPAGPRNAPRAPGGGASC